MLQPLQIEEVSARYSHQIAELREFLAKAGLTLDTGETLHRMALRLREDRLFRRDLTSHVWVVIHADGHQVRHADLLAMLAIAAAGKRFAADAADSEAHDLLRFVMQVWSSFNTASVSAHSALPHRVPTVVETATSTAAVVTPLSFARGAHSDHEGSPSFVLSEENDRQRQIIWIGAAACLLIVALVGLMLHHSPAADSKTSVAATAPLAPETSAPAVLENRDQGSSSQRTRETKSATARTRPAATPYSPVSENSNDIPGVVAPIHAKPAAGIPLSPRTSVASAKPAKALSSRPTRAAPVTRPTAIASKEPDHIPKVVPVDAFRLHSGNVSAGTTRQAIVRPTSLGIMAANVTYSPAPAYPPAASAARLQGEVKLEAEVGRDGTVASTRIISGPPLLADAAADAVQHWRYRPYLYGGKPIAMNAQIVMDFQLP